MKKYSFLVLSFVIFSSTAQIFQSYNINLISLITPNTSTVGSPVGNKYSGCWGWYQASKNKEYAISCGSNGTYFIDVTVATSPSVSAFVPGKTGCTWREAKNYQNYCYIVSDDPVPNKFQIVDMQYLPDSVHVIHSGISYFERAHTIWIDGQHMYIGAALFNSTTNDSDPMPVYSLATPTAPVKLRELNQDIPNIAYVHDMYARNDTIYASAGNQGLHIFKFEITATDTTYQELGSYTGYPQAGYNHSSSLTKNGKYLAFCDEVPGGLPIHFVDVQNLSNIQPVNIFHPQPNTTAHNPYILDNNFAIVSCYQDGLWVYDISNPNSISIAGYFDTYPQGGANINNYGGGPYAGNWGAYPYLPSGIVIANDMQNGVFILNATSAYTTTIKNPVGVADHSFEEKNLIAFPNPATARIAIHYASDRPCMLELQNMLGETVYEKQYGGKISDHLDVTTFSNGSYVLSVTENGKTKKTKLIINH
jgi:choice-of-anchor B domain-containing protein